MPGATRTPEAVLKHWDALKAELSDNPETQFRVMTPEELEEINIPLED